MEVTDSFDVLSSVMVHNQTLRYARIETYVMVQVDREWKDRTN